MLHAFEHAQLKQPLVSNLTFPGGLVIGALVLEAPKHGAPPLRATAATLAARTGTHGALPVAQVFARLPGRDYRAVDNDGRGAEGRPERLFPLHWREEGDLFRGREHCGASCRRRSRAFRDWFLDVRTRAWHPFGPSAYLRWRESVCAMDISLLAKCIMSYRRAVGARWVKLMRWADPLG